ncbi:MAG: glycine cleavage system aminomethyltransferase GcvT [Thaumarchaeota archaeon]|nr:glycine cleavage system aminomethyltransferase GcvT [Nitrososphaerota archaeon]
MSSLKHSHLYSYHAANSRLASFAGYDMPLWYKGISNEHMAVRTAAGLFDVSHMGRFSIKGRDANSFIDHMIPTNLVKVADGGAAYSVLCDDNAGIMDDILVYRFSSDDFIIVVNAANIDKDYGWFKQHLDGYQATMIDETQSIALLALQGPKAKAIIQSLTAEDVGNIKRFTHRRVALSGVDALISRTGYTGEDGFEIFVPDCHVSRPLQAEKVWSQILSDFATWGVLPCGLGARDTLRLEAGLCLYGQDIDGSTNPFEANLAWLVHMDKGDFVGRKALMELKDHETRKRIGISMEVGGIPRHGCEVLVKSEYVGRVTSGSFSPLLRKGIAMGYVAERYTGEGTAVEVSIRGKEWPATVKNPPFYDPKLYGWKRVA